MITCGVSGSLIDYGFCSYHPAPYGIKDRNYIAIGTSRHKKHSFFGEIRIILIILAVKNHISYETLLIEKECPFLGPGGVLYMGFYEFVSNPAHL
jgi:hypothetical protein